MPRLIWTPNALNCIDRLYLFLKEKNPDAAKRAISVIKKGSEHLKKSPQIGKPIDYLDGDYRIYMVGFGRRGYAILYRFDEPDEIVIISIKHYLELEFLMS